MDVFLKDDKLAYINDMKKGNIAQYISVSPDGEIKHIKISDFDSCAIGLKELIIKLISSSRSNAVNVRSFSSNVMKGNKLVYNKNIKDIDEVIQIITDNCRMNKYSIVNENIDINDGGVSGVVFGDIIEFAPKDTPKCVDKDGVCTLEKKMGYSILKTIYGFEPEFKFDENYRVEFSIHPNREGVENKHTIIWEYEEFENINHNFKITWPNKFSQFIGDKTFGLLVADYLGFNVPFTTAIPREVAPFNFGKRTGVFEKWIRTCPIIKEPGKYYSGDAWVDPFELMKNEEKIGDNKINISAIMSQDAVDAKYSGGAIVTKYKENDIIEGVENKGDKFMLGEVDKYDLPSYLLNELGKLADRIRSYNKLIGDVSIEWVYDGCDIWIVQLNQLSNSATGNIIVNGNVSNYESFLVSDGLEALRDKINTIKEDVGINLIGNVGVTSHFGDLLRQAGIPSKITNL